MWALVSLFTKTGFEPVWSINYLNLYYFLFLVDSLYRLMDGLKRHVQGSYDSIRALYFSPHMSTFFEIALYQGEQIRRKSCVLSFGSPINAKLTFAGRGKCSWKLLQLGVKSADRFWFWDFEERRSELQRAGRSYWRAELAQSTHRETGVECSIEEGKVSTPSRDQPGRGGVGGFWFTWWYTEITSRSKNGHNSILLIAASPYSPHLFQGVPFI